MLGAIRHLAKLASDVRYRETTRLLSFPRKQAGTTRLLGPELSFVDGRSCALQYHVMFEKGLYATGIKREAPRIIDAGANIGMATIYFKRLFPDARVITFEADPKIASVLRKNVASFKLQNVEINQAAVTDKEGNLVFVADGADGGHLSPSDDAIGERVSVVRLRDWLEEPTDLLKLDVEGSEVDIIFDCSDHLKNVSKIFVEYHSFARKEEVLPEFLLALRSAGFRIFIQTDYCAPSPLLDQRCDGSMDLRLNIFGVRT